MGNEGNRRTLRVLLVGEGNLSFSFALVKRLSSSLYFQRWTAAHGRCCEGTTEDGGTQCAVLATTFDAAVDLVARYPEADPILSYFSTKSRVHVEYAGDVNAVELEGTLQQGGHQRFEPHLIIFNNPHIGFEDLYRQGSLISHFFASAHAMPRALTNDLPRQVVVSLCDEQPKRWGLLAAAARNGFACVAAVPILHGDYPEYENKRHQRGTKFPYKTMVQYYFAEVSDPAAHRLVSVLLPSVFAEASICSATSDQEVPLAAGGKPRRHSVSMKEWSAATEMALSLLPSPPISIGVAGDGVAWGQEPGVELPALHQRVRSACESGDKMTPTVSAYSLRGLEVDACLPLISPALFYAASASLFCARSSDGDGAPSLPIGEEKMRADDRNRFSPYIDLRVLPQLYRLQLLIEHHSERCESDPVAPPVSIPPTLNAAILGRALTQREAVKLARFLEKATACQTRGDAKKKMTAATEPGKPDAAPTSAELRCPYCASCPSAADTGEPERFFRSQSGYDHHVLTKHSGVAQLHPNMHARVHKQIVPSSGPTAALEHLVESHLTLEESQVESSALTSVDRYCGVCDLLFTTRDAYLEHLAFLSPQASTFVCTDCAEHRTFPDERALQQHRILKHADLSLRENRAKH